MLRCSFKSSFLAKGKYPSRPCEIFFTFFGRDALRCKKVVVKKDCLLPPEPRCCSHWSQNVDLLGLGCQQMECRNDAISCFLVATYCQQET